MKKMMIIVLIVLPLFLMISISIVGKIIVNLVDIPADSVVFVNEYGEEIKEVEIRNKSDYVLNVKVYPELATNKDVKFFLSSGKACTLSDNVLTANSYGTVRIIAETVDGRHQAELKVIVIDKYVESITLNHEELTLSIGERVDLKATILPMTAIVRSVVWSSSNASIVSVNAGGTIYVNKYSSEPIIISATTTDGGFVATCTIHIKEKLPDVAFYRLSEDVPLPIGEVIVVNTSEIDLFDYVRLGLELDNYTIAFTVLSGSNYEINDNILSFSKSGYSVRIRVTLTYELNNQVVTYSSEGFFRRR